MIDYILKRLLLMGITLFGVSLVLFAIVSQMPGRPSGSGGSASAAEKATGAALSTDFERKWRANYHLDKPSFHNRRPWLERSQIEDLLRQRLDGITAEQRQRRENPEPAQRAVGRMRAEHELDDLGKDAVTHLVAIARDVDVPQDTRLMAVRRLPVNTERFKRVRNPSWTKEDPQYQIWLAYNAQVAEERAIARRHSLANLDTEAVDAAQQITREAAWWDVFVSERTSRYTTDGWGRKIWVSFTDTRYCHYLRGLLTGDLGESMKKTRVVDEITERIPLTLTLNAVSFFIIYALALPIGILAAVRRSGIFDLASTVILFMLYSLPSFYVGLMMMRYLTGDWFPVGNWDSGESYGDLTTWGRFWDRSWHSVLPLICLVYGSLAGLSRYARSGLLDIIESDYIRTARAKGLAERIVILKHALRNGALPVLTLMGTLLPAMVGGAVIIEYIFGLRGMGLLLIEAVRAQDYMVMSGIVMISAVLVVLGTFIVDMLYTVVDPRITFE